MKRPSLMRQTYTAACLIAMVPAAIWAAVAHNSISMSTAVGAFPFYYLVFGQLLLIPRYTLSAWAATYMARRYPDFDTTGAVVGFTSVGVIIDAWLIVRFADSISSPAGPHWAGWLLVFAFPWALAAMVAGAAAGGFIAAKRR